MNRAPCLLALAALGSCAPVPAQAPAQVASRCIAVSQIAGRRVVGPDQLLFEMAGQLDYRNHLASRCPSAERLGSTGTVSIASSTGDQLCPGDRVRVSDPMESRVGPSETCVLGTFEPVRPAS